MLDEKMVREHYMSLSNQQLIDIADDNADKLLPAAFQLLKHEFVQRKMDLTPIEEAEARMQTANEEKAIQMRAQNEEEFGKSLWKFIINETTNGTDGDTLKMKLAEFGLNEEESDQLIEQVPDKLTELIDSFDTTLKVGIAIFAFGLFIVLTNSASSGSIGLTVLPWVSIIAGAIQFIRGMNEKKKYQAILESLNQDVNT